MAESKGGVFFAGGSGDVSLQEEAKRLEAEMHRQIGRFVVGFEEACFWLRECMQSMLENDGLRTSNLASILLNNPFMTAANLRRSFESMVTEIQLTETNAEVKQMLDELSAEFKRVNCNRNAIVHSYWYIAYDGADSPPTLTIGGFRGKPSEGKGMRLKPTAQNIEELAGYADSAQSLKLLALRAYQYCARPQ